MRVIKYFKGHGLAILLIVALLAAQAFCDLALPNYTSRLVDVGIQQSGVDHASPEVMTESTYGSVASALASSEGDAASVFHNAYFMGDDGSYRLTSFGKENRTALDDIVSVPLIQIHLGMPAEVVAQQSDSIVAQEAIASAVAEYRLAGADVSDMQLGYLLRTGVCMMGFVALSVVVAALVGLVASRTGAAIGRDLREKLFAKVISFSDAEI